MGGPERSRMKGNCRWGVAYERRIKGLKLTINMNN